MLGGDAAPEDVLMFLQPPKARMTQAKTYTGRAFMDFTVAAVFTKPV